MIRRRTPRRLVLVLGLILSAASAQAEQVNIATSSNPVKKIVIPTTSGTALQATADELKGFLNRMKSGTSTFMVETFDPAVGPNAGTIVLGKATDLSLGSQLDDPNLPAIKERDRYLIASANTGSNIVIAGNTDLAISNGVYDLLEQMGCAWFMPTAAWEIIPTASATVRWTTTGTAQSATVTMGTKTMNLSIYNNVLPDYKACGLASIWNNRSGGNNAHEWQQQWDEGVAWNKRNRQPQGCKINQTHSYANIIAWAKSQTTNPNTVPPTTRWSRDYYSLVDSDGDGIGDRRGDSTNPKEDQLYQLCVSNTAVVQLCRDYATAWFSNTKNANEDSISMEPNDGTRYWCTCTSSPGSPNGCAAMKSGVPNNDYFITDRVVYLANEVAKVIPSGKYVGILAYAKHSGWPSIEIESNVFVAVVNGYLSYGMTAPLLLEQWAAKWEAGASSNLGVYDYYSLFGSDKGLPNSAKASDLKYLKDNLLAWHDGPGNAETYSGESSYTMGMMGFGQYITHKLMWNVDLDLETLRKNFLTKCFGPDTVSTNEIYDTMDQFFKHIDRGNKHMLSTDLMGRLYRYLDTAYTQTTNQKVLDRLDALAAWVRYCEMRRSMDATFEKTARQTAAQNLLTYVWKIRATSMVDSTALWKSPISLGSSSEEAKDLFDWPLNTVAWYNYGGTNDYAPGELELTGNMPMDNVAAGLPEPQPWKESGTFSHSDFVTMVAAGVTANPLLAEEPRIYDHDLIPGGLTVSGARGSFNQKRLRKIGLYLRTGSTGAFPAFDMTTGFSQNKGDLPFTLYANDGTSDKQTGLLPVNPDAPDATTTYAISLLPEDPNSIYIFDMYDYSAGTTMSWAAGAKISMMARSDWPYSAAGGQRRYFYVPKGTKNIIAYAYSIGTCHFSPVANASGTRYQQPPVSETGTNITIPITEDEDEQVWYVFPLLATDFFFQNIPGVLATRQDELLLPKEAFAELVVPASSGTGTRGSFLKMNGTNAFYLRGDALGILPTLSISGTLSGTNTGTSTWRLLSENGTTEYVSGTFVRTSTPQTFTIPINSGTGLVPTSTTDTFLLVYDDNKTVSTINWNAGAKVTIAANSTYKHTQIGGVTRRYFFVPKGTKQVEYQYRSILAGSVYTLSGTLMGTQTASSLAGTKQITVEKNGVVYDNQLWYFSSSFGGSDFCFTSIPGYLSTQPSEMLVPKWTTMDY